MIVQNAGAEGSIVLEKVRSATDNTFGYNALTDTYEDLVQAGVIDPTKVTRTALQNAASIAGLLLTTEALIVEKKEDKPAAAAPAPASTAAGSAGTPASAAKPQPKSGGTLRAATVGEFVSIGWTLRSSS